jgi:hypothetical protein
MGWDRFASQFGIQEPCPNKASREVFDLKSTVMIENLTQECGQQHQSSARIKLGVVDAIDTHENTSIDVPYFMLPRTKSTPISSPFGGESQPCRDFQNQITQSAKPDCIAASAVSCLEVKPTTKVRSIVVNFSFGVWLPQSFYPVFCIIVIFRRWSLSCNYSNAMLHR